MKFAVFFALLIGFSLALLPDQYGFDRTTTSAWYQACKANSITTPFGLTFGGTACVVYNIQSGNAHIYVASSMALTNTALTGLYSCQGCGAVPANVIRYPQAGRATVLTGSTNTGANTLPGSFTLSNGIATLTWTFDNLFNYGSKTRGQPGIRDAMEITSNKDGSGYKVAPTYVETFQPFGNMVLLSQLPTSKNLLQLSTASNLVVVAVGPGVSTVKEGDIVQANAASCLSQLVKINANPANTDDVLALSPYCVVPVTQIFGKISESSYGANRVFSGTGHIKKVVSSSWQMSASNVFSK